MISVIVPVRNEEQSLFELHRRLCGVMGSVSDVHELLFIDDGSTDGSAAMLRQIARENTRVRVLSLDRHHGQASAMQAGFDHARGDIIITLDADLENDPRDIPELLTVLSQGFDVVCGRRVKRSKGVRSRCSRFGNLVFRTLFRSPVHDMACTFRAYRHAVLSGFSIRGTLHRYLPVLLHMRGARVTEIEVYYAPRKYGVSNYRIIDRVPSVFRDILLLLFLRQWILHNSAHDYRIGEIC